jgi:hypothetical protein
MGYCEDHHRLATVWTHQGAAFNSSLRELDDDEQRTPTMMMFQLLEMTNIPMGIPLLVRSEDTSSKRV